MKKGSSIMLRFENKPHNGGAKDGEFKMSLGMSAAVVAVERMVGAGEIIEAFADRATIEQDYHDVKEVWGSGQQQVRNIWHNLAVYNLNLWMHTLVELWAWDKSHGELCDRSDSPWDDAARRPSHANRRPPLSRPQLSYLPTGRNLFY